MIDKEDAKKIQCRKTKVFYFYGNNKEIGVVVKIDFIDSRDPILMLDTEHGVIEKFMSDLEIIHDNQ